MNSNLPVVRRSCRVLLFLLNLMYDQGGHKLEINITLQQICANSQGGGGLIIKGEVISSEYSISLT